jgi:uracil phosphoribosyltransferase
VLPAVITAIFLNRFSGKTMENYYVINNPLVNRDLTILRDKDTKAEQFRNALQRIAYVLAIEMAKKFELEHIEVETPLETTAGYRLKHQIVLVPVLRAGLSLAQPFIDMIPSANVGHIGLERDEETLKPSKYYYKTPNQLNLSKVILLDPMLATGGSASAALTYLKDKGAEDISMASLIAAPEGIERINRDHPDVFILTAHVDRELNEVGYILPGLGDAGDRTFGTL